MPKSSYKYLLFFLPILLVFQPFFIKEIQYLLIGLRYIAIPLLIIFNLKFISELRWFFIALIFFSIILMFSENSEGKPYIIYLNILSSICYFIFGTNFIAPENRILNLNYLRGGVNLINVAIIVVYLLAIFGFTDFAYFFRDETTLIEGGYKNIYDRFTFGNAIEVPFLLTSLLYIAILSKPKEKFIPSVFLNLIATLISGSRIMIVLGLILLINELNKVDVRIKIVVSIFTTLLLLIYIDQISLNDSTSELIFFRFANATESGSAIDRITIFSNFLEQFPNKDMFSVLFGDGFQSSYEFMRNFVGGYRTVESVLVQLILETGLIGFAIVFGRIFYESGKIQFFSIKGASLFLIFLQLLIFLPIFTYMQVVFLLFGFLTNIHLKKEFSVS